MSIKIPRMHIPKDKIILAVGGDMRQVTVAKLFADTNTVYCIGIEQINDELGACVKTTVETLSIANVIPDYIIFPMPVSLDEKNVNTPFSGQQLSIDDVLSLAGENTVVFGGKISQAVKEKIEQKKLWYMDYLDREELAVLNAVPTAEGAVQIAMEEMATTIFDTACLIIGYGRIAKVLARYLSSLGADVTVSARKYEDMAWIRINGYKAIHTDDLSQGIKNKQLVFNTVPARVLNEQVLSNSDRGCLIIDLASKPGGIDFDTANRLGIKTIWALSLPGKISPITAGKIIYDTIINIESERGKSK